MGSSKLRVTALALVVSIATAAGAANWPERSAPAIPGTFGYVNIPNAAVPRDPSHVYKALFDVEKANPDPAKPAPQLLRIAGQINGLVQANVPAGNILFATIHHGDGADAILTNAAYRQKHGIDNPNVALVTALQQRGVKFYVCGQFMAAIDRPASDLLPGVQVAEGATLVMIRLQNDGYAFFED